MIYLKIKEQLEKNNMSRYKLRQYSSLTYKRVNDYYFNRVSFIKVEELEIFCKLFKCKIEDIIEYKN